jgi:hypothetical protein
MNLSMHQRQLRALIALQNAGVTLIERRSFNLAQDVLRDSVEILHLVVSCNELEVAKCGVTGVIESKLYKANQHLSCIAQPAVDVPIRVFVEDATTAAGLGCTMKFDPSEGGIYPIRIEKNDFEETRDMDNDLLTAIIFYNCGLAFLCQARLCQAELHSQVPDLWQQHTILIFELCSVALECFSSSYSSCSVLHQNRPFRSLYVDMMILQGMVEAYQMSGDTSKVSDHVVLRLAHLRSIANRLEEVHLVGRSLETTAAAA